MRSDESEKTFGGKKITFTIFSNKRQNIYANSPKLELICHDDDELDSWKASLLRAGVYPEVTSLT
jgi:dynamin GTPase